MKPTKNQVYCFGCMHHKMLFETEAKADNFIKFNSDEIAAHSGKAPSRSYYCSFCCGWHITSISNRGEAASRDERDAEVWEHLRQANELKKIKIKGRVLLDGRKIAMESRTPEIVTKFPKTQQGVKLRIIAERIDNTISKLYSAFTNVDIHMQRYLLDLLEDLEESFRSKSDEYDMRIPPVQKRLDAIDEIKTLFATVFDYFTDIAKRQSYLSALTDEDLEHRENIIINNFDVSGRIDAQIEHIHSLSSISDIAEIRTLCDDIINHLIPLLKGECSKLKRKYRQLTDGILTTICAASLRAGSPNIC